jgi:hypothetical protein
MNFFTNFVLCEWGAELIPFANSGGNWLLLLLLLQYLLLTSN